MWSILSYCANEIGLSITGSWEGDNS